MSRGGVEEKMILRQSASIIRFSENVLLFSRLHFLAWKGNFPAQLIMYFPLPNADRNFCVFPNEKWTVKNIRNEETHRLTSFVKASWKWNFILSKLLKNVEEAKQGEKRMKIYKKI